MEKELKVGQKIWCQVGWDYNEAEIMGIYNNGNAIDFIVAFDGGKLSKIAKLFRYFYRKVESKEQFLARII